MERMSSEERVERIRMAFSDLRTCKMDYSEVAALAISEQDRREGLLVEALHWILGRATGHPEISSIYARAHNAIAAYNALDAKPEPTLAECEKRLRDLWAKAQSNKIDGPLSDALDAWKTAVERAEGK